MQKIISMILAWVICLSAVCAASAAVFTPSVENKGAPAVVELKDEDGNAAIAKLNGNLPEGVAFVSGDFLVVTAVSDAESSDRIPDASEKALLEVYNGLQSGSLAVPFEELNSEKADKLVVRDLFDVSWTTADGNDLASLLDAEDVSLEMCFDIGIAADDDVYVMIYKNDEWKQIQQVTNNGDGTITCVFDHLCPVAVIVEGAEAEAAEAVAGETLQSTQDMEETDRNVTVWIGVGAASLLALAAVVVVMKRKQK